MIYKTPESFVRSNSWANLSFVNIRAVNRILLAALLLAMLTTQGFRELWIDEAMLMVSIRDAKWKNLLSLELYNQASTLGHLIGLKLLSIVMPSTDAPLRALSAFAVLIGVKTLADALSQKPDDVAGTVFLLLCLFGFAFARYATEIKPYAFDFAFASGTLGAYIKERNGTGAKTFGPWILLSLLFSYSTVFVVAALAAVHIQDQVLKRRGSYRPGRFELLVGMYFCAFGIWHVCVTIPSTKQQMLGFSYVYASSFLSGRPFSPELWMRPMFSLVMLQGLALWIWSVVIIASSQFSRSTSGDRDSAILRKVLLAIFVLVFVASLAGAYPLREQRHFLFLFAVWCAAAAEAFGSKYSRMYGYRYAFAGALAANLALGYMTEVDLNNDVKDVVLKFEKPVTHLYPNMQPAYEWYFGRDRAAQLAGYVNPKTGSAEGFVPSAATELLSGAPGTWPALWKLKDERGWNDIDAWFRLSFMTHREGAILTVDNPGRAGSAAARLFEPLKQSCTFKEETRSRSVVIVSFNCGR